MNFTLEIMGTASAMPISDRNPSAHVLNVHGRLFLIDCGEGTQQQIRRHHLSFVKIEAVFVSHTHGDHIFGIFGLLSTMSMYGRTADLDIYAPYSFKPILDFILTNYGDDLNFGINYHPLKFDGMREIHISKSVRVSAFPLRHKIECYGFRFDETVAERRPGNVPFKPRSYAYCSDTMHFDELASWVKGVDLLYHEATYPVQLSDKAASRFHSTTHDAARCALEAGVGKLVIGHYSSRFRDPMLYQSECREIFPESYAANDDDVFEI